MARRRFPAAVYLALEWQRPLWRTQWKMPIETASPTLRRSSPVGSGRGRWGGVVGEGKVGREREGEGLLGREATSGG